MWGTGWCSVAQVDLVNFVVSAKKRSKFCSLEMGVKKHRLVEGRIEKERWLKFKAYTNSIFLGTWKVRNYRWQTTTTAFVFGDKVAGKGLIPWDILWANKVTVGWKRVHKQAAFPNNKVTVSSHSFVFYPSADKSNARGCAPRSVVFCRSLV